MKLESDYETYHVLSLISLNSLQSLISCSDLIFTQIKCIKNTRTSTSAGQTVSVTSDHIE